MNILRSPSIAAFTTLYCVTMLPLCGMENLAAIAQKYDWNASFAIQVAWANEVLCYNKNAFAGIDSELYETAADALTVLNGSIDNEITKITGEIQKNPFKMYQWSCGGIAAILGATLVIWRKPLFTRRTITLIATTGVLALCEIGKKVRRSELNTQITDLQTLQKKIGQWIKAPSPFKVSEVETGDLYPDVDKS